MNQGQAPLALAFLNSSAGAGSNPDALNLLKAKAIEYGFGLKVELLTDQINIPVLINQYSPEVIIAGGGDGTINRVGKHTIKSGHSLSILPLGSTNSIAKNLNIPIEIGPALDVAFGERVAKIDYLLADGNLCLHTLDLGFNAALVKEFDTINIRGRIGYLVSMFKIVTKYKDFKYRLEIDGVKKKGHAFQISITSLPKLGSQVWINPGGDIDDGKFEVVVIKPYPWHALPKILIQLVSAKLHNSPYTKTYCCEVAGVDNRHSAAIHIDGEPMKLPEKFQVKLIPKGFKVRVPAVDLPETLG